MVEGDRVVGAVTQVGLKFRAKTVVLTAGTFLNGLIHVGLQNYSGGRAGDPPAISLGQRPVSYTHLTTLKIYELLLIPISKGFLAKNSDQESRGLSAGSTGAAFNVSRAMRLLASDFAYTESGRMRCAITKPVMHASICLLYTSRCV